jgi:hypothetical protein
LRKKLQTDQGYVKLSNGEFEHRVVWEQANGRIPKGHEIHHINFNKRDNRLENLVLVTRRTHKRIHSGCRLINGELYKPCKRCGKLKSVKNDFYVRDGIINSWCKTCVKQHVKFSRMKKLASRTDH